MYREQKTSAKALAMAAMVNRLMQRQSCGTVALPPESSLLLACHDHVRIPTLASAVSLSVMYVCVNGHQMGGSADWQTLRSRDDSRCSLRNCTACTTGAPTALMRVSMASKPGCKADGRRLRDLLYSDATLRE